MFRYIIVFITFIVLILVGVLYLKTDTEPNQYKGVGNSTLSTTINGSGSDNLSRVALVMGNGNYHHAEANILST